uniref:GST N-terminal domain-containing protein n=1 Tax=Alexandrium monilatum TaxID=311494 RepID=A0A7S4T1N0_9DINO
MAFRAAATAGGAPWAELAAAVRRAASAGGFDLHEAGRRGLRETRDGPPSAQAEIRTFGSDEKALRVVLYRDNHAWCPYCHKVWLQLEEKRVPYRVEKVSMNCYGTKSRAFLSKTARGLLPALEIDGHFYTESSKIMQLIEETFPERPLLPASGPEKGVSQRLLALERELFGAWLHWLRAEESPRARREFERAMDATDRVLEASGGRFFLGAEVSLADVVFASSLERIAASILYYKGLRVKGGRWPSINAWFAAMEEREAYRATQSDFHTHVHDLPPQIGGCLASGSPEQRMAAQEIDGRDGRSWKLPLPPLTLESLEPGSEVPALDRLEAANALVHCHEGVLRSSRGGPAADAAFRYVVRALVEGVEGLQGSADPLRPGSLDSSAAASLRWTRDRICVPRDMSFPAARQLRAHLNWAADIIDPRDGWQGVPLPTSDRRDSDPVAFAAASL